MLGMDGWEEILGGEEMSGCIAYYGWGGCSGVGYHWWVWDGLI